MFTGQRKDEAERRVQKKKEGWVIILKCFDDIKTRAVNYGPQWRENAKIYVRSKVGLITFE